MEIPAFPNWREIVLEDKPTFDRALAANPPELSTYTFTNLFAWRNLYESRVSRLNGMLLVKDVVDGRQVFLEPMGDGDIRQTILDVFELSGEGEVVFERLHKAAADLFDSDPAFSVQNDRGNSDYVYLATDLMELAGRKYDAKRNFINRFKTTYDYSYQQMTQDCVEEAHKFVELWCEEKLCRTVEGLRREQCAVYEMLMNFEALGITGGAIKIDEKVVAFELGEALNADTLVIHVEKADASIHGIYQAMNNEFCTHEARAFTYVNREQDMGVPGLRKAKESYHPVKLIEAYSLRRPEGRASPGVG